MNETAVQFGKTAVLSGVLSEPERGRAQAGRPAFLMLNAGILHRVGSCRLHVRIARRLSADGVTALRFDFSGIGDSRSRRDDLPFEASARAEVREAMDYLEATRGVKSFVLLGLCSGADMAHLTALEDERVAGIVSIDAWAYRTPAYWFHHYGQRLFKARVWKRWATIRMRRLFGEMSAARGPAQSTEAVAYEVPRYVRHFPPRDQVAAEASALTARGVRLFSIFTGGQTDHYNHRRQYRRSFRDVDFGDRLRVEFIPTADHIITDLGHQAFVVQQVAEWAAREFAPQDAGYSPRIFSAPTPSASA